MSEAALESQAPDAPPLAQTALGLLALQALPGIGPRRALRAAILPGGFDAVVERHAGSWPEALEGARCELDRAAAHGIAALSVFERGYPARLRDIDDPPPVLFVGGSIEVLGGDRLVAVVGTREPTVSGRSTARALTVALAGADWAIVSGLARGVDTVAHVTALERGATTVAVLPGGLGQIYPPENRELAAAIVARGGALVTEQRWATRPHRAAFAARDRIQTALSVAVLVAQAGIVDGTMHTVRHAAAQGRPVFCPVPDAAFADGSGLRVLLEEPARRLCALVPAWKDAGSLSEALGDEPLARPVSRNRLGELLEALDRELHREAGE